MNIGKALFNATSMIAVASVLAACSSGGGSDTPPPAAATTPVAGAAFKGPFIAGSAVAACPFAEAVATGNCATAPSKVTTATTGANGAFSLPNVTWSGASLVTVSGNYLNEITGNTNQTGVLKAVLVLGAAGGAAVNANPNIATTIAAELLLAQALANPGMVVNAAAAQAAGSAAASALGLPAGTDPNTLTLSDPAMLTVSAAFADVLAAGTVDLSALATSFATDVSAGLPLGSTPVPLVAGGTSTTLATTLTTSIATASNPANYATPPAVAPIVVSTALKGYGLSNNTLTVGDANTSASCAIADTAPATAVCTGNAPASAPVFNFAFHNVNAPTTLDTTIYFDIADSAVRTGNAAKRQITGSIPVSMAIDANGKATATVAAGAVLTFTGVMADGTTVSGTAVNDAVNTRVFDANGASSVITVNPVKLKNAISIKMGASAIGLLDFTVAGTYTFKFGTAAPVGLLDTANTSIVRLVPLAASGRREISGSVTIQ